LFLEPHMRLQKVVTPVKTGSRRRPGESREPFYNTLDPIFIGTGFRLSPE
jgi:hypothetical protein